jgi:hypothetical protein
LKDLANSNYTGIEDIKNILLDSTGGIRFLGRIGNFSDNANRTTLRTVLTRQMRSIIATSKVTSELVHLSTYIDRKGEMDGLKDNFKDVFDKITAIEEDLFGTSANG